MTRSKLTKHPMYSQIRRELSALRGREGARDILTRAQKHYAHCASLCADASKGERSHLKRTILPTAAIYKALLETDPENALTQADTVMTKLCAQGGRAMGVVLRLPGMKAGFMRLLPKLAKKQFGPECGFAFENFRGDQNALQMDMTACPYCRYSQRFGCPELTEVFCRSDFAVYGNLPGIQFLRTQTLGTGGSLCDFRFLRKPN